MTMHTGFIGLGNIGFWMAKNIADAGLPLTVYDLDSDPVQRLADAGARAAASLAALARESDLIALCVRDDADVETVLFGDGGIAAAAAPGTLVAIHSTIRPRTVVRVAERLATQRLHVLDVPMTGGPYGAQARNLCYMAGGDAALIERCRPVFATSAKAIVATGPLGSAMATKLCNNLIQYLGFLAAFEGRRLADGAGISLDILRQVAEVNGVLTPPMLAYLGMQQSLRAAGVDGEALERQLERFADLAEKDLAITLEFARDLGIALPAAALCQQLMAQVYGVTPRRKKP
jgi:3-hydroxyisobutyrate dehydrogenase